MNHTAVPKLSRPLISHISRLIGAGQPLHALLTANEYRQSNPTLWVALQRHAKPLLTRPTYRPIADIVQRSLDGETKASFSKEMRHRLQQFKEQTKSEQRKGSARRRQIPALPERARRSLRTRRRHLRPSARVFRTRCPLAACTRESA